MAFNSIAFAIFFAAFFLLYWIACARSVRAQNVLVLAGSYAFYALGDWRFLPLLAADSAVFFALGAAIHRASAERARMLLVAVGVIVGLGQLVFFKYTAFLLESIAAATDIRLAPPPTQLLLPLGISFFTFRCLSYLFDIRRGRIEPTGDWLVFFSYVAFFPCLVAGPIDRPGALIPQLAAKREFDYALASDGVRQAAWGLFKKIVIADNCASFVDEIYENYRVLPASSLALGAVLYSIQLYADFSGYSDMALGLAKMLGIRVTVNFEYPFFAQNIAEFWRRWHMSLTTWMTDYLFTPLTIALRDLGKTGICIAIVVTFTLIGAWHGASWTFVLFGFVHGCLFVPLVLRGTMNRRKVAGPLPAVPRAREAANMLLTFSMVTLTFVLFRSASVGEALEYLQRLASPTLLSMPVITRRGLAACVVAASALLILVEWMNRDKPYAVRDLGARWPLALRWSFYYAAALFAFFAAGAGQNFIYVQF